MSTPSHLAGDPPVKPPNPDEFERPLTPHVNAEEHDLYVDVDHTSQAYEIFCQKVTKGPQPLSNGVTVFVGGESGCGKTSTINRCVAFLNGHLLQTGMNCVIVDLRRPALPPLPGTGGGDEPETTEERQHEVFTYLVSKLSAQMKLPGADEDRLLGHAQRRKTGYAALSRHLTQANLAVLVILPESQANYDAPNYISYRAPNIAFFAEAAGEEMARQYTQWGSDDIISLSVGPLNPEDAWKYATKRINSGIGPYKGLTIDELDVQLMMEKIRAVQSIRILNRLMNHAAHNVLAVRGKHITYSHLSDHWLSNSTLDLGRGGMTQT
ncbi:hypothetical protein Misp01_79580 [Microtetraspora sp. NBRC 13810]|uniref:hypothetical protein n=1 Tax=Microtetraspora sp. NBRC 13810 TaxID=3030990 RepID=UPI0024A0175C|nr:hypothetical protein [Microtetraspora sp. NBRC 13810]GLW12830.1 hypothetical protein Misp01_79580 [Microtetraspora sp. NBRC 13810]